MARRTPELLQYLGKQDHQKLFQVLTRLPRFGVGRKFTRAIWRLEDTSIKPRPSYWTITRVVPNKVIVIIWLGYEWFCPQTLQWSKASE